MFWRDHGLPLVTLKRVLLIAIILEVSLGGGGRLFETGSVSPRMVLFVLALAFTAAVLLLYRERVPRVFVILSVMFVALSGTSSFMGVLTGQSTAAMLVDFRPMAYFMILPFFALTIRTMNDVVLVSRLLKFSALTLAILYLGTMAYWTSGAISTIQMFEWLNPEHTAEAEFLFRGETTFFFKALLYVGVGVFFFIIEKKWYWIPVALTLLLAIAITMTRGMWLAVFIVMAMWAFLFIGGRMKGTFLAIWLISVGILGALLINHTLPSVEQSNAIRLNDLRSIAALVAPAENVVAPAENVVRPSPMMVVFGHGFGAQVFGRTMIEITYVNIFVEQGLIGIIFWLLPLAYMAWQVIRIRDSVLRAQALPYLMGTFFVYVVSLTNPFLTNPIGMAVVLIAMVVIRVIRQSSGEDRAVLVPGSAPDQLERRQ